MGAGKIMGGPHNTGIGNGSLATTLKAWASKEKLNEASQKW